LLAGDEAVAQPAVDGRRVDVELAGGVADADQLVLCARGCGVGGEGGDAVGVAQVAYAVLGEAQPGGGAPLLVGEHERDRLVVVVGGEAADELDRVLRGGAVRLSLPAQPKR
jgi:hypothetical protein